MDIYIRMKTIINNFHYKFKRAVLLFFVSFFHFPSTLVFSLSQHKIILDANCIAAMTFYYYILSRARDGFYSHSFHFLYFIFRTLCVCVHDLYVNV